MFKFQRLTRSYQGCRWCLEALSGETYVPLSVNGPWGHDESPIVSTSIYVACRLVAEPLRTGMVALSAGGTVSDGRVSNASRFPGPRMPPAAINPPGGPQPRIEAC